ncbi:hypothetical protein F4677DRAFT_421555 [Hypoxylon crocopeplum]|nr:hypothetical protein F4677DRAFT_421555 [Hypoxylon crocopeplum]
MGYPHFAPTLLWNLPLPSELGINKPADIFAFSPDDKLLLTLHEEQNAILWDLAANSLPRKLGFGRDNACSRLSVKAAALLGESGGFLVVFGVGHPAQHYDILNEAAGSRLSEHVLPAANDVSISRDGRLIVLTTGTTMELWDAQSLQRTQVLTARVEIHSPFEKAAISQDEKYAAAVDAEGRFSVWGLADDFFKASRNKEVGIELGVGWSPTSIGLNEQGFVMAVLRKRTSPGQDSWMLMSWGYKYEGPDNTLYAKEYSSCALACVAPSTEFNVVLTPKGHLSGRDSAFWRLFATGQGASKKGKVVSSGISGSSKMLAAARTNGRLAVWRLYTKDADPNEPYPG